MSKSSRRSAHEHSNARSRAIQKKSAGIKQSQPIHPLLRLQQSTGNQAVGEVIQTKLTIGQSGDHYEQEADQIAMEVASSTTSLVDQSAQMSAEPARSHSSITPVIQTATSSGSSSEASSNIESQLRQTQGNGSPLPEDIRNAMESRLDADFSRVRVHTDNQAAQLNREFNAKAFTHREDIYFDSGRFNPTSKTGKQLLAHELTHVVQQTGGKSRKASSSSQSLIQRDDKKPKAAPPDHTAKINGVVKKYNDRLKPDVPLDPKWVQAMMLVETKDVNSDARKFDPLQVANRGDPALKALKSGTEHTDLITTTEFREALKQKKQTPRKGKKWDYSALKPAERMDASTGIEAAIAWLFSKAAQASEITEEAGDELEYTVKNGDTYGKIAPKLGTTVETLMKYNTVKPNQLKVGDKLKYKKATKKWKITSWKAWEDAIKAYNGGGDPDYFKKVKKEYDKL